MLFQFIHGLRKLAGAFKRFMQTANRARNRRAMRTMLQFEDRFLRDIGLTRADIVDCLSSPETDPVDFLDERRMLRRSSATAAASAAAVAAPEAPRLAA